MSLVCPACALTVVYLIFSSQAKARDDCFKFGGGVCPECALTVSYLFFLQAKARGDCFKFGGGFYCARCVR